MSEASEKPTPNIICPPDWYAEYIAGLVTKTGESIRDEILKLDSLSLVDLNIKFGGDIRGLQYDFLRTLFPTGSDNSEVAEILRKKREEYLKEHPEEQVARGASEGIIGFDGRFYPKSEWDKMTAAQRREKNGGNNLFSLQH